MKKNLIQLCSQNLKKNSVKTTQSVTFNSKRSFFSNAANNSSKNIFSQQKQFLPSFQNNSKNNYSSSSSNTYQQTNKNYLGLGIFAGVGLFSSYLYLKQQEQHSTSVFASDDENWKTRMKANYNNRIREFSSPEKIFETFAEESKDGELYMTLRNFRDSLLPATANPDHSPPVGEVPEVFKQADVDGDGLISFSEYLFFTTLLAIPKKHYKVSFRMFDKNGDGTLDIDEFLAVMNAMREQSALGKKQRESPFKKDPRGVSSGNISESSGLLEHFFGKDGKGCLSYEQFAQFLSDLQCALLQLEFQRYSKNGETITAKEFALAVVGYAQPKRLNAYKNRANTLDDSDAPVTFKQFCNYHYALQKMPEVSVALKLYGFTKGDISKSAFQHAVKAVADCELTDTQVNVIFHVFDDNGDGKFDFEELISVMAKRTLRGLTHEREFGISRFFSCIWQCTNKQNK